MCLDCLACRERCEHLVQVPANLAAARLRVAESVPPPVPEASVLHDLEEAWRLLRDVTPSWRKSDDCQALLVPGRELLKEDALPVLHALFQVLDLTGDKVVGVNRDSVLECGHYPYAHGHWEAARREAQRACGRFGRYARVVFGSPHCLSFVLLQWPEAGLDRSKQAVSLLEFVGKRLDLANPGFFPGRLAYQDPCHLGRHLGQYQIPRDILKWAADREPTELLHSRDRATCCGGGYPLSTVAPAAADRISRRVIEEAREAGAEVLVTACGECTRRLAAAGSPLLVLHIMQVIAEMGRKT
jgi:Fe-S oxidoreductase